MQAAIYRDGALNVGEAETPALAPGQVLVKTLLCGICGSDLHFAQHAEHAATIFKRTGSPFEIDLTRPIVMGHEFCGEVADGASGTSIEPGTRVCSMPFTVTGSRPHFVGYSADQPGGFGQYMALNEMNLVPIPNGLSTERAALTEPLAVGWHAVRRGKVTKDDVALVLGCGPIGLAVIAGLKVEGVRPIVAADFNAERRAIATAMGADVVIDPAQHSPYKTWIGEAQPAGYDPASVEAVFKLGPLHPRPTIVFECVGAPGVIQSAFAGALPGTRLVVVGICMEPDTVEPLYAISRELDVHYSIFYDGDEFKQSLHHIAEGMIDVTPLVSRTVGLGGVKGAFDALASGSADVKVLVDPWRA